MFSGIVEETGKVVRLDSRKNLCVLKLSADKVSKGTRAGDSVAVNGVCLTVTGVSKDILTFDMMRETLIKTTLGALEAGDAVNLERALKMSSRVSGHFVTGHVDEVGTVSKVILGENYTELRIRVSRLASQHLVPKGSVCLDGVSLTIGEVKRDYFSVYLIPFTKDVTTLGNRQRGSKINIETDILAKYVKKSVG